MTLTGIGGSLGIGVTQPSTNLQVEGGGAFSGNVTVGNNLTVGGALLGNVQGTLTGNVAGTLDGNSNTTVGISTLNNLTVSGVATVGNRIFSDIIGIGTDEELDTPFYVNSGAEQFFVTGSGSIGIRTSTELENVTINASSSSIVVDGIGVGSTVIVGAADFKNAGPDATRRFMIPPKSLQHKEVT